MLQELDNLIAQIVATIFKHKLEAATSLVDYAEAGHGEFATSVSFKLAGTLKIAPAAIAEQLAAAIKHNSIKSASADGGYVNIVMTDEFWTTELAKVDEKYGQSDEGKGQKVQVEFISANPTGPLTLGNGRGGYNGDVLANALEWSGYDIELEYYLNDTGNKVKILRASIYARVFQMQIPLEIPEHYKGEYIGDLAGEVREAILEDDPEAFGREDLHDLIDKYMDKLDILGQLVRDLKASTVKMGITFDRWFSEERELHQTGEVASILKKLHQSGVTEEKDGAVWLKGGDDRDRVLVKSDGTYTYLLVDLAYHWNKLAVRKFDKVINLWGADHAGQVPSLIAGLKALGQENKLDVILFQLVRLLKDGNEYKVSKRAGTYVTIDELIELTGSSDVARFFFLTRSADTQMDFDLDLAKEQSQKNPYWYVMYSYARAHSILKQATEKGLKIGTGINVLSTQERTLIKQISQFPNLLEVIIHDYSVHKLTFFAMEVAKCFHDFYESEKIIALPPEKAAERLYLIQQYLTFMNVYFDLMGITPIERMD